VTVETSKKPSLSGMRATGLEMIRDGLGKRRPRGKSRPSYSRRSRENNGVWKNDDRTKNHTTSSPKENWGDRIAQPFGFGTIGEKCMSTDQLEISLLGKKKLKKPPRATRATGPPSGKGNVEFEPRPQ